MRKIFALLAAFIVALGVTSCNSSRTSDSADTETPDSALNEIKLEQTVVIDNEQCRVTVTGFAEVDVDGSERKAHELYLQLENKTSESELIFYGEYIAVNGTEWNGFYSEFVSAGEEKSSEIYFATSDFDESIGNFNEIELEIFVHDNSENGGDTVGEGKVTLCPYGNDAAQ